MHCVCVCRCVKTCLLSREPSLHAYSLSSLWITLWENCQFGAARVPRGWEFWLLSWNRHTAWIFFYLPFFSLLPFYTVSVCDISKCRGVDLWHRSGFWSFQTFLPVFPTPLVSFFFLSRNSFAPLTFILNNTSLTNWPAITSFSVCQWSWVFDSLRHVHLLLPQVPPAAAMSFYSQHHSHYFYLKMIGAIQSPNLLDVTLYRFDKNHSKASSMSVPSCSEPSIKPEKQIQLHLTATSAPSPASGLVVA